MPNKKSTASSLDNNAIIVILLLIFIYPIGLLLMWILMKSWSLSLKLVLSLPVFIGVLAIIVTVMLLSTSPSDTSDKSQSTPNSALNQAHDTSRQANLQITEQALKMYYSENNMPPQSLEELVPEYLGEIPTDPVTKKPLTYTSGDQAHGCTVEIILSDGTSIFGYCK